MYSLYYYFSSIAIELLLQDGQRKFCGFFWFDRDQITLLTTDNAPYDEVEKLTQTSLQIIKSDEKINFCVIVDQSAFSGNHSQP